MTRETIERFLKRNKIREFFVRTSSNEFVKESREKRKIKDPIWIIRERSKIV